MRTTTGSTGSPERRHSRPADSPLDVEVTLVADVKVARDHWNDWPTGRADVVRPG